MNALMKSLLIGGSVVLLIILLVFLIPCPSASQYILLRIAVAFLCGIAATWVTGLLVVNYENKVRFGAGIFLILLFYFISPSVLSHRTCMDTPVLVQGRVVMQGIPVMDASISLQGYSVEGTTNQYGEFEIELPADELPDTLWLSVRAANSRVHQVAFPANNPQSKPIELLPTLLPEGAFQFEFEYALYRAQDAYANQLDWESWWDEALNTAKRQQMVADYGVLDTLTAFPVRSSSEFIYYMREFSRLPQEYRLLAYLALCTQLDQEVLLLYERISMDQYSGEDWNNLALAQYRVGKAEEARTAITTAFRQLQGFGIVCRNYQELTKVRVGYQTVSICRDGTESESTGSGSCSHHGGVARTEQRPVYSLATDCNG